MAFLSSSLIRCALGRCTFSALGKSLSVSANPNCPDKIVSELNDCSVNAHHITKLSTGRLFAHISLQNWRRNYATVVSSRMEFLPEEDESKDFTKEKLSKAAKAYLERAQKYDEMISEARAEYTTGMRHLANMMGENPETFTQADANVCHFSLFSYCTCKASTGFE